MVHVEWLHSLETEDRSLAASWLHHVKEDAVKVVHGGTDTGLVVVSPPARWCATQWVSSVKQLNASTDGSQPADESRLGDIDADATAMVSVRALAVEGGKEGRGKECVCVRVSWEAGIGEKPGRWNVLALGQDQQRRARHRHHILLLPALSRLTRLQMRHALSS